MFQFIAFAPCLISANHRKRDWPHPLDNLTPKLSCITSIMEDKGLFLKMGLQCVFLIYESLYMKVRKVLRD